MRTGRLEAFSDGVMAIIITIMMLDLHVPKGTDVGALLSMMPALSTYLLSFLYVGIYWNNHHHLFLAAHGVNGGILWANLHLLFWLSLFPVTTAWIGHDDKAVLPTVCYGIVLLLAAMAWAILQRLIVLREGLHSSLQRAIGRDLKWCLTTVLYGAGVACAACVKPLVGQAFYLTAAIFWLVPDRRIEAAVDSSTN